MSLLSWPFWAMTLLGWGVLHFIPRLRRAWVLAALSIVVAAGAGWAHAVEVFALCAGAGIVVVCRQRFADRWWATTALPAIGVASAAAVIVWPKVDAAIEHGFLGVDRVTSIGVVGGTGLLTATYVAMQAVAYVVESAKHPRAVAVTDPVNVVGFFSHLAAGPLVRIGPHLKEIHRPTRTEVADLSGGLELMAGGAIKKIALADPFLALCRTAHDLPLWPKVLIFAATPIAVYFDASGYVDLARGAARVLGVNLPKGFSRPLTRTRNPSEFWRRWQTHLMTWFRTYIYQPVYERAGRAGPALFVTFLLAALWHGVSLVWLLMGAVYPLVVGLERWSMRWRYGAVFRRSLVFVHFSGMAYLVAASTYWPIAHTTQPFRGVAPPIGDVVVRCIITAAALYVFDRDERARQLHGDSRPLTLTRSLLLGLGIVMLIVGSGSPSSHFVYASF